MQFIALLLLDIHLAFAGMHSVQYFCTVVSKGINLPVFTVVGMVDDQQFLYFDSNTMKAVPKTEWMRANERADHWDKQTQIFIGYYKEYKNTMYHIMDLFSHNMADVHTFQIMCGCELDGDDDTNRAYYKFGYDGEDFISFDNNTLSLSAASAQADIKNKWEAKAKYWKACLENTCTESLKKYLSYGNDTLERKVPPKVSLLQKDLLSSSVICHATGFYPKNITMTWMKNHKKLCKDVNISSTLPNADGTFQKSISLLMKPEKWKKNPDVYRCVIQHVAAEKKIVVTLNENKSKSDYDNIIALAVGLVVSAAAFVAIIGCIVWKMAGDGSSLFCFTDTDGTELSEQAEADLYTRNPSDNRQPGF